MDKPKYYIQDLDNYTREHLINIILYLDGEVITKLMKHCVCEDNTCMICNAVRDIEK